MKTKLLIFLIIFIAGLIRLFQLGNSPYGFTNDEIVAVYNAYSLWQTHGFGLSGTFLPLTLNDLSPVPIYIDAFFQGILGLSPFVARLPYALSAVGVAVFLFLLVKKLFNNNSLLGFFTAIVFAFSPWDIVMSRGAWETNFALYFYLLAIYLFVRIEKKGNILWSLPAFLLGFYSYNATKIFLFAFLPILLWLYRKELLQRKKELIAFCASIFLIVLSFAFVLRTNTIARANVLIFNDKYQMQQITNQVNFDRSKSSAPGFLKALYTNKVLISGKKIADNYIEFFSPQYLFLHGDLNKANDYGRFFWGQQYFIELPLFLFGIFVLVSRQFTRGTKIFFAGLLCSPLPSAVTTTIAGSDYFFRSAMAIPFLAFFTGAGLYFTYKKIIEKPTGLRLTGGVIIVICFIFFISKFFYNYSFQFVSYGGEYWTQSSRIISYYIASQRSKHLAIYILTPDKELVAQYGFFNSISPREVRKVWAGSQTNVDNVYFISNCSEMKTARRGARPHSLFISDDACMKSKASLYTLRDTIEPVTIWRVYEN